MVYYLIMEFLIDLVIQLIAITALSGFLPIVVISFLDIFGSFFFRPPIEEKNEQKVWNFIYLLYAGSWIFWFIAVFFEQEASLAFIKGKSLAFSVEESAISVLESYYVIGFIAAACILYELVHNRFSSFVAKTNIDDSKYFKYLRRFNVAYIFSFVYLLHFLIFSDLSLYMGFNYLEVTGLIERKSPVLLFFVIVPIGFGPYIIYFFTLVCALLFGSHCFLRILSPDRDRK